MRIIAFTLLLALVSSATCDTTQRVAAAERACAAADARAASAEEQSTAAIHDMRVANDARRLAEQAWTVQVDPRLTPG